MQLESHRSARAPESGSRLDSKNLTFRQKINHLEIESHETKNLQEQESKPTFSLLKNILIENSTKKALESKHIKMSQIHQKKSKELDLIFNFTAHNQKFAFAQKSIYLFDENSKFRYWCVWIQTHK